MLIFNRISTFFYALFCKFEHKLSLRKCFIFNVNLNIDFSPRFYKDQNKDK